MIIPLTLLLTIAEPSKVPLSGTFFMRSKILILLAVIGVFSLSAFFSAASAWAAGDKIVVGCVVVFRLVSANATVSSKVYRQFAIRNLSDLDGAIRPGFGAELVKGKKGLEILDVGGGYSLYGVQLAQAGHKVVTINAQDFYSELLYPLGSTQAALVFFRSLPKGADGTYLVSENTVSTQLIRRLSTILGIALPRSLAEGENQYLYFPKAISDPEAVASLATFFSNARTKLEQVERQGGFRRVSKLAQDELPQIKDESKDRIIDSFGAFYYSSDRLVHAESRSLLSHYYRILRPGGKAEISVSALSDTVSLPGGRRVDLYDFLAWAAPRVFQVSRHDGVKALTMIRIEDPHAVEKILIGLGKPVVTIDQGADGLTFPSYLFTLQRSN